MPGLKPHPDVAFQIHLKEWMIKYHKPPVIGQAYGLPLRRDMVTLLKFVRDNKVVGTQNTGNMPLKMVREVTARFVDPPQLDHTIGDHTYRLRTEANVWPLYFLHILAEVGGLLAIAPGRRWRLTAHGKRFLSLDPLMQVVFLGTTWWHEVNWLIAYPYVGMGDELPPDFQQMTLARLRALPLETDNDFEKFADDLIAETGLTWLAEVHSSDTLILRGSIERMVVNILAKFGGAERKYREEPLGQGTIQKLDTFAITPLGQALLDSIRLLIV